MFEIEYKGANCVLLSTKKTTLTVNPRLSLVGLKDIKSKDEVELATEAGLVAENTEAKVIIEGPGEYEVGDFTIRGVAALRHIDTEADEKLSTLYRIETIEYKVGLIGNIAGKLDDDQLEGIGMVDILILPIGGGGYTLDATAAATIVRHIDPKVVIPVHYADSGLRYEVPQEGLDTFVKELGAPVETVQKYKLKSPAALPQTLTIVEVTRS